MESISREQILATLIRDLDRWVQPYTILDLIKLEESLPEVVLEIEPSSASCSSSSSLAVGVKRTLSDRLPVLFLSLLRRSRALYSDLSRENMTALFYYLESKGIKSSVLANLFIDFYKQKITEMKEREIPDHFTSFDLARSREAHFKGVYHDTEGDSHAVWDDHGDEYGMIEDSIERISRYREELCPFDLLKTPLISFRDAVKIFGEESHVFREVSVKAFEYEPGLPLLALSEAFIHSFLNTALTERLGFSTSKKKIIAWAIREFIPLLQLPTWPVGFAASSTNRELLQRLNVLIMGLQSFKKHCSDVLDAILDLPHPGSEGSYAVPDKAFHSIKTALGEYLYFADSSVAPEAEGDVLLLSIPQILDPCSEKKRTLLELELRYLKMTAAHKLSFHRVVHDEKTGLSSTKPTHLPDCLSN